MRETQLNNAREMNALETVYNGSADMLGALLKESEPFGQICPGPNFRRSTHFHNFMPAPSNDVSWLARHL
eukprot:NODE_1056_length_1255_cov_472.379167.p5 GENE.NODE_1056_length_1255_cov_472.379167~~NODE_1056_length_1255_cov_472.379167.p5  ORF type:complete len:70 (-),score=0.80 NODE_1056_length_1255_cov_472.379167:149-358(-)